MLSILQRVSAHDTCHHQGVFVVVIALCNGPESVMKTTTKTP